MRLSPHEWLQASEASAKRPMKTRFMVVYSFIIPSKYCAKPQVFYVLSVTQKDFYASI